MVVIVGVPTFAVAIAYWIGKTTPGHAPALKDCCGLAEVTIWGDIRGLPGSAGHLGVHLYRIVLGLAMPFAVLAAGAVLVARSRLRRALPAVFWGSMLVTAFMVAQPLLIGSKWNAGAEPRLTSLAIGPAVAAVAVLLTLLEERSVVRLRGAELGAVIGIFALGSLSHRFANVGPRTPAQFAALELVCMVAVLALLAGRRLAKMRGGARLGGYGG